MASTLALVFLSVSMAVVSEAATCQQREERDFRADENDCSTFHMCSMGQLVTFTCGADSVFDERSKSCVPAHTAFDTCSQRLAGKTRCPTGSSEPVPHATHCALYYDCGATHAQNRQGWESQLRECLYPMVFHTGHKRCVQPEEGVCAGRQEPIDMCDYKENQCEGHSNCVPCNVRFPSCRGLSDGMHSWVGRQGSPWFVVCQQQRVRTYDMCKQDGAVFIFDDGRKECVKQEEATPQVSQQNPQTVQQARYVPAQGVQPQISYQQRLSFPQQPTYQQRPVYQPQLPTYQQRPAFQQDYQQQTVYQQQGYGQPASYQNGYQTGNSAARPVQYV